jgi:hypothetical protein
MSTEKNYETTTTIGVDYFEERIQRIANVLRGHAGHTQHFISLARHRDATHELQVLVEAVEFELAQLKFDIFKS